MFASCLILGSCSAEAYRESADEKAYQVIADFQNEVYGSSRDFTVDPPVETLRKELIESLRISNRSFSEEFVLDLEEALVVAAENSREYQRQKEQVFLTALDLVLQRWQFQNRPFGVISGDYDRIGGGEGGDASRTRSGDVSAGFTRQLAQGGRMVLTFAADLVRRITGFGSSGGATSTSLLSLSITQPLLRGAGRRIALEPLTQSERNLIYALRDFERFRLTFAIQIANDFYSVLLQGALIFNEELNRNNVLESFNRTKALAETGRLPLFQVDQAEQSLLSAENRLINARNSFATQVDRFKLTLGLPTDARVSLDELVLQAIRESREPEPANLDDEQAILVALENRRDLKNVRDRFVDAERRAYIAKDALRAGLEFSGSLRVGSEFDKPFDFSLDETDYLFGLSLDLPFDRVAEANAYRASLIALEQAKRSLEQFEDNVKFDIRQGLRSLAQAQETYEIQKNSVALAEARVNSTELLLDRGRAQTRDLLEAQEALVAAKNSLINALINYRVTRLEILRDLGILEISENELFYRDNLQDFEIERPLPSEEDDSLEAEDPVGGDESLGSGDPSEGADTSNEDNTSDSNTDDK